MHILFALLSSASEKTCIKVNFKSKCLLCVFGNRPTYVNSLFLTNFFCVLGPGTSVSAPNCVLVLCLCHPHFAIFCLSDIFRRSLIALLILFVAIPWLYQLPSKTVCWRKTPCLKMQLKAYVSNNLKTVHLKMSL